MPNKKRIIVSVTNDIYTDQRVRKVCEFLVAQNYDVVLVGRKLKSSKPLPETKYATKRFSLWFTKGALFYANYNIRLFFYLIFKKADVLLSNDLDTLLANYLAKKFKSNCRLVYDSHELFTGVPELVSRPKIQKIWTRIEKWTVPKVDKMYTVNESIASVYRQLYQREVLVVRNISDFKGLEHPKTRQELGLPLDKFVIILQGAGINIDRGAEELIAAMNHLEGVHLIFVGGGDVIDLLKEQVIKEQLSDKVTFFGKKPYQELMNYTLVSDLGVSLDKDTNINYRYSLPNKIFDYIHAGIPLMVSDLKEIAQLVKEYNIGVVVANHHPKTLAETVENLIANPDQLHVYRENTKKAAEALNWQNECHVLKSIF